VVTSYPGDDDLAAWCEQWLGATPVDRLFSSGYLSTVLGLRLSDARDVVVKVRPFSPRIRGCVEVQRHLWESGFPCPMPLAGPAPCGTGTATAEQYVPGGTLLERNEDSPIRFAALLWQLINRCAHLNLDRRLDPPPPWVAWDHTVPGLWPAASDRDSDADLNTDPEPRWLNEIGARTRTILLAFHAPPVVGHVDWESQNIRWQDGRPLVVHDWDSAATRPEATIAGAAAAVFARSGDINRATVEESDVFLDAYQRERGRPFTKVELNAAWAAGLWVLAFDTKENAVNQRGDPEEFADEAWERLQRASS
jgi:hypothetical protein